MNHQFLQTLIDITLETLIGSIMMSIFLVDNEEEKVEKLALVYAGLQL